MNNTTYLSENEKELKARMEVHIAKSMETSTISLEYIKIIYELVKLGQHSA